MTLRSAPDLAGPYRIGTQPVTLRLGPGVLRELSSVLRESAVSRPVIVMDAAVGPVAGPLLAKILANVDATLTYVDADERSKTLTTVASLAGTARDANGVVAIGGGTTGNIAGTLAHLLRFGAPLINVPTTVAAAVDAAVSARHSLNTSDSKNLIGTYHAPSAIIADPMLLTTLPPGEWREGAVEAVKAALIAGGPGAAATARALSQLAEPVADASMTVALIKAAITLKLSLISDDPCEQGPALALHYGHTLSRALETYSGFAIRHGPAVSAGIALAALMASESGLLTSQQRESHVTLADLACEPAAIPAGSDTTLLDLMADGPNALGTSRGGIAFVLPEGIGSAHYPPGARRPVTEISRQQVASALARLPHARQQPAAPANSDVRTRIDRDHRTSASRSSPRSDRSRRA
jgi:3-dehydroquinate synthase